ncbi:hypothetical protein LCGC14_1924540, partial [marine sediment metagenome]
EGFARTESDPGTDLLSTLYRARAALADSADAPENDQTVRARKQAAGLDRWAKVLEAHEPESSAAGILMLHEAAKTLRCFADAPPGETGKLNIVRSIDTTVRNEAFCRPLVWEKAWRRSDGQEILNGHGRSIGIAASEADAEEIVEAHNTALAAAQKEE